MGLQDRDYMRERGRKAAYEEDRRWDRPFTPPRQGPSTLVMVLVWVSVAFVLYRGYEWIERRHQAQRVRANSVSMANDRRDVAPPVPHTVGRERVASLPPVRIDPQREMRRASPVQEEQREAPAPPTSGTIYLCKAYNGGTFWSQAHCGQHQALIDSIVPVPAGLPFEQQVELAQQGRQATVTVSTTTVNVGPDDNGGAAARKAECKHLDARVEQLDGMARQPQSGQMQDWIRGQRQEARDRQFALRC